MNDEMKMDAMFYASYMKYQQRHVFDIVLTVVKDLLLIIFMPIDYTVGGGKNGILTVFMAVAISITTLQLLLKVIFFCSVVRDE